MARQEVPERREGYPAGDARDWLKALQCRWMLELADIYPGMPEYQAYRDLLMPISVDLGCVEPAPEQSEPLCWRPGRETNGFMMVTGGSGSGKTEALKLIGWSLARHGVPVITLDFHGDVLFPGQTSVQLQAGYTGTGARAPGLNPLALDAHYISRVGLGTKISREVDRIRRATGGMGYKQGICLRQILEEAYRDCGIWPTFPDTWGYTPPTLADVSGLLAGACEKGMESFDRQVVTACYAKVETLACNAVFAQRKWLTVDDLLAFNMRLDCSLLGREARLLVAETVLEMIFEAGRAAGPIPVQPRSDADRYRAFVMIDEAKILSLGRGNAEDSDHILNIIITEGRKYGIGLILASQMSAHFGSEVHANVATRLAMKRMDPKEARSVARQMGLDAVDLISAESPPGRAYFRGASSDGTVELQVGQVPPVAHDEITSV